MNNELRQDATNDFEKECYELMNNFVFGKTIENLQQNKDIKLIKIKRRRNYLVFKQNCHTTMFCTKNLISIVKKKTQIDMNKLVYIGLSILDISKTKMYNFWYDYLKPKYKEKADLCLYSHKITTKIHKIHTIRKKHKISTKILRKMPK